MRGKKRTRNFGRMNENNDLKVKISLSISQKLLAKIEENIKGNSRSEKVSKCAAKGYFELAGQFQNLMRK